MASTHQGDPAHCLASGHISLWDEVQQRQGDWLGRCQSSQIIINLSVDMLYWCHFVLCSRTHRLKDKTSVLYQRIWWVRASQTIFWLCNTCKPFVDSTILPCRSCRPQRVAEVTDSWWHSMLILPPLFKHSPASPFLLSYYPDCVGMSPSGSPSNQCLAELRADHCRAVQPQSKSGGGRGYTHNAV